MTYILDDSSSMNQGTRFSDQREIAHRMARIYELLPSKHRSIDFRLIHIPRMPGFIQTAAYMDVFLKTATPRGNNKIGTDLAANLLRPWVYDAIASGSGLKGPIIVYCFTGGCPNQESPSVFKDEILRCAAFLESHGYDRNCTSFNLFNAAWQL